MRGAGGARDATPPLRLTGRELLAGQSVIQVIIENVCGRAWIYGTLML
jgi:hypothetical protein